MERVFDSLPLGHVIDFPQGDQEGCPCNEGDEVVENRLEDPSHGGDVGDG